ncbi:hypothetical protein [Brevundimonas sp. NIBR11]|uniref:hypothetical protein n=1 Tax=Brevundimonas sp. NIBR11 TaxID=3015999 RepID=UPI0022F06E25|nr:hypothetical protein [Brevundimonas sp. NIBR11]WGM32811.1 hypothetical protein KKHFBJBL_03065 [Brevundimonas sp. NIBR11]
MIRALLVAAVLSTAAPAALAQTTAPAPSTEAPAADAPGEAEFEARAEAFGERMQQMGEEMQAAITAAAGDSAKQDADLDALEARYQPDVDAFVAALEGYVAQQAALVPEAQRAEMNAGIAAALPQIRAYPRQIRAQVEQAAAAPAPTPPAS